MSLQQDQFMNQVRATYNRLVEEFSEDQLAFAGLYMAMSQDLAHVQDIHNDDSLDVLPVESVTELCDPDLCLCDESGKVSYTGPCPMLAELINQASR